MRTIEEIQQDIRSLRPEELRQIRDFLDDLVEDELEFTDQFEAQIQESEEQLKAGLRPRVRKP